MTTYEALSLYGDLFAWNSAVAWVATGITLLAYFSGYYHGKKERDKKK